MMTKRKLGKGLDAVLTVATGKLVPNKTLCLEKELYTLPIERIFPGKFQPRKQFTEEELGSLAGSIKEKGILQPILVRNNTREGYELIAGERRWRAAKMAGLTHIPAILCNITDEEALAFGLVENIQRQELNPIEEAEAIQRLIQEFSMTHEKVAQTLGRSRTMVSNLLRLLNLAPKVREMLIKKQIDMGHARALLALNIEQQEAEVLRIVEQQLSVRQTEKFVKQICQLSIPKSEEYAARLSLTKEKQWSNQLAQHLSANVTVKYNQSGKGRVVIETSSMTLLEKLVKRLAAL